MVNKIKGVAVYDNYAKDGREGTILTSELLPDKSQFSQEELEILDAVYQRFKKEGPTKISEMSHQEEAWKKYINRDELISFDMAFCLKAIYRIIPRL